MISGPQIYTEKAILKNTTLEIRDNKIHALSPSSAKAVAELSFPENYHLVPGFIDVHIHGANGSDVMDATPTALQTVSEALAKEGTTSFLATTMTASPSEIENVLIAVRDFMQTQHEIKGAKILGVHLEGPFLSAKKIGAQREDAVLIPQTDYIERWQKQSDHVIKLITLAPELPGSLNFIRYLITKNIIASIGHTDATYSETIAAIDAGCSHVTHLFNAMRGIHQREPGAITAALLSEKVTAELIVDGVHLHPAIVELAFKIKGKDQLILVTDAMRAKCLSDGSYDLGGQTVEVKNHVARLSDGTLAGSTLTMSSAIQNMLRFAHCNLSDVIQLASENPARMLNIFQNKGSIAPNKDADLVVLDDAFNVVMTMREGNIIYFK